MKVMGPNTIFAVPPGCMGGVGVVGWDKQSGAKCPVFFPLLDNVASMLAGIKMHYKAHRLSDTPFCVAGGVLFYPGAIFVVFFPRVCYHSRNEDTAAQPTARKEFP